MLMMASKEETILLVATLPLPPGINASYKTATRCIDGKTRAILMKTQQALDFEQEASLRLNLCWKNKEAIEHVRTSKGKQRVGLAVELSYFFETLWRRDIDGGDKAALDVVFQHLQINDNRILDLHVRKSVDAQQARLEVIVKSMEMSFL